MFRKLWIPLFSLPFLLQGAPLSQADSDEIDSGGQALIVRSVAIGSPKTAFAKWFKPEAEAAFAKLTAPTFDGKCSYELSDFFNTSLILAGAQKKDSGITAFYSPWQDAILIVRTEGSGTARRGAEFLFLTGETFRGEKFSDSLELVAPEKAPLSVNLWRVYTATVARFNELFPVTGNPDLAALKQGVRQEEEFQNIRLRSSARTILAKKLMTDNHRPALANCLIALRALQTGNEKTLKKVFGAEDAVGLQAALLKVPEAIRKNIEPVYSLVTENGSQFGFLNPGAPRFIFLVSVDKENKFALEWFDINDSAALYKAWEDAK